MFGLLDRDLDEIRQVIRQFPQVETVTVFGSRAKGNYKPGSDVDLALEGKHLNFRIAQQIKGILNEDTLMPYHFDVLNKAEVSNAQLLEHINRVGLPFPL